LVAAAAVEKLGAVACLDVSAAADGAATALEPLLSGGARLWGVISILLVCFICSQLYDSVMLHISSLSNCKAIERSSR
jgi:hypothetical protein